MAATAAVPVPTPAPSTAAPAVTPTPPTAPTSKEATKKDTEVKAKALADAKDTKDAKDKAAAASATSKKDHTDEITAGPSMLAGIGEVAKKKVVVKVGMVGDSQIGKTSLMVKYVEGNFNEDYIQTLGVNFMEKTISLRNTDITFSIWDLGGQQEFLHMLPLVCNDAVALLFMFDLSRKSTLSSIKNWYKQARLLNKTATPFLIGTKYDFFAQMKTEDKKQKSQNRPCGFLKR